MIKVTKPMLLWTCELVDKLHITYKLFDDSDVDVTQKLIEDVFIL